MNINDLFQKVFAVNVQLPVFVPISKASTPSISNDWQRELALENFYVPPAGYFTEASEQGAPMWDVFRFAPGNKRKDYTLAVANANEAKGWQKLSDFTVVSLSRPKNVVVTPLAGSDNNVVELINKSNWELRFFGFILDSDKDQYPLEKVQELNELYSHNTSAPVASKLLNGLGIFEVVFTNLSIDPVDGNSNLVKYELTAMSVEPIELLIQEDAIYE